MAWLVYNLRVSLFSYICFMYTVSGKKHPDIFDCNLKKNYRISIIFDTNIFDTTGDQTNVHFSTAPIVYFCTTWENKINEILHFYPISFVWFFPGSAETDIWWGGNYNGRLMASSVKNFAPKIIKICQFIFKSQSIMLGMLFDFLFILMHNSVCFFFPGSAETEIGWGEILNGHSMASCARNVCIKND